MDDSWVCGACHSINQHGSSRCYSCRQSRTAAEAPPLEIPLAAEHSLLSLGGAVTMVCPACRTPRVGWSSECQSCGLSFDGLAIAELGVAASDGPGPLVRLLLRRLRVLIPGLILLAVLLVVFLLNPSLFDKLQR